MGGERSINLQNRLEFSPVNLSCCAAAAGMALLVVVALMVVVRRCVGALAYPLEPPAMFTIGLLTVSLAIAVRWGWLRSSSTQRLPWIDHLVMGITSLAAIVFCAALCVPGTDILGMSLLCLLLGIEESGAWAWHLRRCSPIVFDPPQTLVPRPSPPAPRPLLTEPESFPDEVTQQLTRSQTTDGVDTLSGWLRMTFTAGQRTGSIHVAFCPPFAATPELEVEQIDGPDARIKTAQLLPYGVRLDLKLAATAEEPTCVLLQFSARTVPAEENTV